MASSEESSVAQVRDTLQNKLSEFISAELEKMKVGLHSLIREAIEEETEKLNDRMETLEEANGTLKNELQAAKKTLLEQSDRQKEL